MATKAQIVDTAAQHLALLSEGTQLRAEYSADLTQAYTEVYAELQGLNLTTWASTANIPDEYARSVAMLVADARAVKYPQPQERYVRIKGEANEAMHMIRKLQAKSIMGQTQIENF